MLTAGLLLGAMYFDFLALFAVIAAAVFLPLWLYDRHMRRQAKALYDLGYSLGRMEERASHAKEFGPLTEKLKQAVQAEGELARSNERLTKALDRLAL